MISIIITSYKEPKTIGKAIESFINQKTKHKYELIAAAPDKETLEVIEEYAKKYKQVKLFKDPGKGKTFALNLILPKLKGEIIILTDGDVFVSNNSINELVEPFKDKKVGCVTGYPVSADDRKTMFGYWSHLLCYAAHRLRLKRDKKDKFLECSGYIWAFRNNVIKKIPRETAEDTIVPCLFYLKGYKIKYVPESKAYVKFPTVFRDFVEQKKRTAKGHETLGRYVDVKKIPRMKTLKNEIFESTELLSFPQNMTEIIYTLLLVPLRLYIWMLTFFHLRVKKNFYVDAWKRIETTK